MRPILYRLHTAGDLHIGSGVGLPGLIDEYVVRDENQFVYIPASEIKGIVRDSCAKLLRYRGRLNELCEGQIKWLDGQNSPQDLCGFENREPCILCAIFGSPVTPAGFWFSPARYAEQYRHTILDIKLDEDQPPVAAWRDSATSAHAAIDRKTKRAAAHQLFNLEVVRTSEVFEGFIRPLAISQPCAHSAEELLGWLTASLLFTRRLGGRRRKGWGRCRFTLVEDDPGNKAALAALEVWLTGKG